MENKNPSQPIAIKPPMYCGVFNVQTGTLTVWRDDENGKLTYEQAKPYLPKTYTELPIG